MIRNKNSGSETSKKHQLLQDLRTSYECNALKLFAIAHQVPTDSWVDNYQLESKILAEQEAIIEKVVSYPIQDRSEARIAVDIWYQATIKETCEAEISAGDKLILSLYRKGYLID